MKTYLQKFLIIEGFDDSMEIVVKTPKKYFLENKKYIGLSVLRRSEQSNYPSFTPMPLVYYSWETLHMDIGEDQKPE